MSDPCNDNCQSNKIASAPTSGIANTDVALQHVRIPANVTGHYGDRDRFAHGLHAGESFVR